MKDQIPQFLQEQLTRKKVYTDKFPDNIKLFIINYAILYKWDISLSLRAKFNLIKQGVSILPTCNYNGCDKNISITIRGGLTNGCCKSHSTKNTNLKKYGVDYPIQNIEIMKKRDMNNIKKFGSKSPLSNRLVQDKIKLTNLLKYGVENISQSEMIKAKKIKTSILSYGTSYPFESDEIKQKIKATHYLRYNGMGTGSHIIKEKISSTLTDKYGVSHNFQRGDLRNIQDNKFKEKYGVNTPLEVPEFHNKLIVTNLLKYGVPYPSQNNSIMDKIKATNLIKYGVENPMQVTEFFIKNQKSSFKRKEYIWKTGEISLVQGNEPIVLKELEEEGYKFNEVLTSPKDMPKIMYHLGEKEHRYYPDIFIPKDNIIIEVKSNYTLKLHWDKNQAKFEATKSLGFDFKLEVR